MVLLGTGGGERVCEGDGRSAGREFVPVVLTSRDTEVWPANKMLNIKISVSSHLVGVCQLEERI